MAEENQARDVRQLTDEEVVEHFQDLKAEGGGDDPRLAPPSEPWDSAVRDEMERRGLTPDREDIIPDSQSPEEEPVVEDRA